MTRDENGRFIKCISGNPAGRPKRAREEQYYRILEMAVSSDYWASICVKAVEQAKRGDAVARKWIADYLIGTPPQKLEHSGQDGNPLEIVLKWADENNNASSS